MTLWEIGKLREGYVSANTVDKTDGPPDPKDMTDEEFARLMAVEIIETNEVISFNEAIKMEKTR